ncbi:leucine-rich repeat-containing protein 40-like [Mytilus trossulus]|uniref:leucine-rich repeat-containing protein 40-like n=1 Tax=Mytilus trossulus TaxID=6551 RepID=UPI00300444AE
MAYICTPRNLSDARSLRRLIETEDPIYYGMKKLKIRGRDLNELPRSIFSILELEVLELSPEREACLDFKLPKLPPAIGKLINLKVLILDTNEMQTLATEVTLLVSLERLALSNNHLSSLPNGFKNLTNLKSLHLSNNEFEEFPLELCDLENLEFLDMCDNMLEELPHQISNMKNLHTLLLCFNRLRTLPDSICQMTELRCLWLGNNLLQSLPKNFGQLRNIDWDWRYISSLLEGNPLVRPPIEVCRLGMNAIDKYLNRDMGNLTTRSSASSGNSW